MVSYVVYGRGSFNQLDEILAPHRKEKSPMIFLVDHFFENKPLVSRIPLRDKDKIIFADVSHEPKTKQVDQLAGQLKAGIRNHQWNYRYWRRIRNGSGQGRFLMMTNPGSSADYQGWDLVKYPVYIKQVFQL